MNTTKSWQKRAGDVELAPGVKVLVQGACIGGTASLKDCGSVRILCLEGERRDLTFHDVKYAVELFGHDGFYRGGVAFRVSGHNRPEGESHGPFEQKAVIGVQEGGCGSIAMSGDHHVAMMGPQYAKLLFSHKSPMELLYATMDQFRADYTDSLLEKGRSGMLKTGDIRTLMLADQVFSALLVSNDFVHLLRR